VDKDEDHDDGGYVVAGDGDGGVEGRKEGMGCVDCKTGINKVSRTVTVVAGCVASDLEPTVTVTVDAALLMANMTTQAET
jgi:hypothetical protein